MLIFNTETEDGELKQPPQYNSDDESACHLREDFECAVGGYKYIPHWRIEQASGCVIDARKKEIYFPNGGSQRLVTRVRLNGNQNTVSNQRTASLCDTSVTRPESKAGSLHDQARSIAVASKSRQDETPLMCSKCGVEITARTATRSFFLCDSCHSAGVGSCGSRGDNHDPDDGPSCLRDSTCASGRGEDDEDEYF